MYAAYFYGKCGISGKIVSGFGVGLVWATPPSRMRQKVEKGKMDKLGGWEV